MIVPFTYVRWPEDGLKKDRNMLPQFAALASTTTQKTQQQQQQQQQQRRRRRRQ